MFTDRGRSVQKRWVYLLHTGAFRFVYIYVSALIFTLLSYSMLCWLPDLLLAFGEAFGILYMNFLDEAF